MEAWADAAALGLARDEMRRNPHPFAEGCDHDMEDLPVIDFLLDSVCRKCGGVRTGSAHLPA